MKRRLMSAAAVAGTAMAVMGVLPAMAAPAPHFVATTTSGVWAGYATQAQGVTDVIGDFTLPTATCGGGQDVAFWTGIDGFNTSTVEQTGVDLQCQGGSLQYAPWYEMYPAAPVFFQKTAKAGDKLTAEVKKTGAQSYELILTNHTENWTNDVTQQAQNASDGTAEWIAERQLSFGSVAFSNCMADGKPISGFTGATKISESGSPALTPSDLSADGKSFTISSGGATAPSTGSGQAQPTPPSSPGQGQPGQIQPGQGNPGGMPGGYPGGMPRVPGSGQWQGQPGQGMPQQQWPGSPCPWSQMSGRGVGQQIPGGVPGQAPGSGSPLPPQSQPQQQTLPMNPGVYRSGFEQLLRFLSRFQLFH